MYNFILRRSSFNSKNALTSSDEKKKKKKKTEPLLENIRDLVLEVIAKIGT